MKIKMIAVPVLAAVLLTGCVSVRIEGHGRHHQKCERCEKHGKQEHHHWRARQARLLKEARVSNKRAERTALAKVPKGTIKEAELEKEHGKLQWSFDIATPNSNETTEVNVDAVSGDVISVSKESATHEAREGDRGNERE